MNKPVKNLVMRLLALSVCSVGAAILLAVTNSRELLPPRWLGVAMFVLLVGIGLCSVIIVAKSASEYRKPSELSDISADALARNRRLLGIRMGTIAVAILALLIVLGLFQGFPKLAVIVGSSINLFLIAVIFQVILKLRKKLP